MGSSMAEPVGRDLRAVVAPAQAGQVDQTVLARPEETEPVYQQVPVAEVAGTVAQGSQRRDRMVEMAEPQPMEQQVVPAQRVAAQRVVPVPPDLLTAVQAVAAAGVMMSRLEQAGAAAAMGVNGTLHMVLGAAEAGPVVVSGAAVRAVAPVGYMVEAGPAAVFLRLEVMAATVRRASSSSPIRQGMLAVSITMWIARVALLAAIATMAKRPHGLEE